jgi:hypothetical protein
MKIYEIISGAISLIILVIFFALLFIACFALVWEAWDDPEEREKRTIEWEERDAMPEEYKEAMRAKYELLAAEEK